MACHVAAFGICQVEPGSSRRCWGHNEQVCFETGKFEAETAIVLELCKGSIACACHRCIHSLASGDLTLPNTNWQQTDNKQQLKNYMPISAKSQSNTCKSSELWGPGSGQQSGQDSCGVNGGVTQKVSPG
jgi:hypothetical protein